ncbi:MAG TPA: hypothetical protein VK123_03125 [Candidatus Limnocylindrales bacterium]|nr:hypothetical protein [Candidatus Limnocylindrales bacterium]
MSHRPLHLIAITLAALAAVQPAARPARAQTLKLGSLRVFHSDVVGPWVSYRVRTQSGRTPVREFTQRVAIVAREKVGNGEGYWVELKTTDRSGARIERGLFASGRSAAAPSGDEEGDSAAGTQDPDLDATHGDAEAPDSEAVEDGGRPLRLVRYQMLAPGGKLYEYPVSSAYSLRAGGGVSTYELFEFDPTVKPVRSFLGPDTLRMGRRVVPAVLEWNSRTGTDDWPVMEDSTFAYRLVLTQTLWRNPAVPVTGFARSLFRVTTKRVPAMTDSAARTTHAPFAAAAFASSDTTLGQTTMQPGDGHLLSWTELILTDLGADAVAEVTQAPEPAPAAEQGTPPALIR